MIEEAYVSSEVAKLLKEKGFDEECRSYFIDSGNDIRYCACHITNKDCFSFDLLRPTQQMAMRWLRKIHGIYIEIRIQNDGTYVFYPFQTEGYNIEGWDRRHQYSSYEDAVEAALKYCLEDLL